LVLKELLKRTKGEWGKSKEEGQRARPEGEENKW
jgi:hypothetical protein